ncbi:Hypothetical Protein FCC1311_090102 [Hondaea fermentalgiana]|uniref:Uncharacterized protein n=1 Tax=Hondaea fermentalgiana TaxID=2315210 RepID=A0A2R5GQ96_9STRA|nr:Hypothetical Protein FCC1311_090102 [Hondaea fermentalgiana]|eukprot:GBG32785.1 Hypothetical Protein FCC1311_090102 [Hondaea fermentalgiana]
MHIPKTAGSSAHHHLREHPSTAHLVKFHWSTPGLDENCLQEIWRDGLPVATLFREPRAQLYSQFMECTHDSWGKQVTRGTAFPRAGPGEDEVTAFEAWLRHFSQEKAQLAKDPSHRVDFFNCYYPDNMQARYLLHWEDRSKLDKKEGHTCHGPALDRTLPPSAARELIEGLWFVGLKEHFALSMCLFEFQLRGDVSEHCLCDSPDKTLPREAHGNANPPTRPQITMLAFWSSPPPAPAPALAPRDALRVCQESPGDAAATMAACRAMAETAPAVRNALLTDGAIDAVTGVLEAFLARDAPAPRQARRCLRVLLGKRPALYTGERPVSAARLMRVAAASLALVVSRDLLEVILALVRSDPRFAMRHLARAFDEFSNFRRIFTDPPRDKRTVVYEILAAAAECPSGRLHLASFSSGDAFVETLAQGTPRECQSACKFLANLCTSHRLEANIEFGEHTMSSRCEEPLYARLQTDVFSPEMAIAWLEHPFIHYLFRGRTSAAYHRCVGLFRVLRFQFARAAAMKNAAERAKTQVALMHAFARAQRMTTDQDILHASTIFLRSPALLRVAGAADRGARFDAWLLLLDNRRLLGDARPEIWAAIGAEVARGALGREQPVHSHVMLALVADLSADPSVAADMARENILEAAAASSIVAQEEGARAVLEIMSKFMQIHIK